MLKITEDGRAGSLRLEGQLIGPWVAELRVVCDNILTKRKTVRLQLHDVDFVDRDGVALLLRLERMGVAIEGCSPFVQQQRNAAGASVMDEQDA